jgi:hypothetical protein
MRKRLYRFDNDNVVDSYDYIEFNYDKIVYIKIKFSSTLILGRGENSGTKIEYDKKVLWDYSIEEISKADPKYKTANYKININQIKGNCDYWYFVNLNLFELFRLRFHKKETWFHKLNFYQRAIGIIIVIIVAWIPIKCSNQKSDITQSPKPDLTTINQEIGTAITKAAIHETQNSKSDSLCLDSMKIKE